MASEEVISASGFFDSYRTKGNFDVEIKVKFLDKDLPNALQFVAGIGKRLNLISAIKEKNEKVKLGKFYVHSLRVDNNSNCFISFKSNKDECFVENFPKLLEESIIEFKAKVINE